MSPRMVSHGKCVLCGGTLAKNAITRHLEKCLPSYEPATGGKPTRLFHIRIEGQYAPEYWLHVEIRTDVKLTDPDDFSRGIWLGRGVGFGAQLCAGLSVHQVWRAGRLVDVHEQQVLCNKHHQGCDDALPLVNSPRVGQCGYSGPCNESLRFEERAPKLSRPIAQALSILRCTYALEIPGRSPLCRARSGCRGSGPVYDQSAQGVGTLL